VRHPSKRSCEDYNAARVLTEFRVWNEALQLYTCIAGYDSTEIDRGWGTPVTCTPCGVGHYNDLTSTGGQCKECPDYTTTNAVASVSSNECAFCATDHRAAIDNTNRYSSLSLCETGHAPPRAEELQQIKIAQCLNVVVSVWSKKIIFTFVLESLFENLLATSEF